MNKRLIKELHSLIVQQSNKELLENDYIIYFDDTDMSKVYGLIKPPKDSVYRHKFIKLYFKIPENYPHSPPEVFFVNHDGVRIHPNMYEDGKCCSTILNTWGDNIYEKWTSSMGIETILLAFHSFFDNHPYTYEPGGGDDESYTQYVLYQTWKTCLLKYLQYETISEFKQFIHNYLLIHIEEIFKELKEMDELYSKGTYFTKCFEIENYTIDYERITQTLEYYYSYIEYIDSFTQEYDIINFAEFLEKNYKCNICFDTSNYNESDLFNLECNHSFHKECLREHITSNQHLCPMCRTEITNVFSSTIIKEIPEGWIINPLTKRRVKIGSRTYKYLLEQQII
jgi:ubiquitin-protein ligase